jgi:uncharacterized membrane protein YesL
MTSTFGTRHFNIFLGITRKSANFFPTVCWVDNRSKKLSISSFLELFRKSYIQEKIIRVLFLGIFSIHNREYLCIYSLRTWSAINLFIFSAWTVLSPSYYKFYFCQDFSYFCRFSIWEEISKHSSSLTITIFQQNFSFLYTKFRFYLLQLGSPDDLKQQMRILTSPGFLVCSVCFWLV